MHDSVATTHAILWRGVNTQVEKTDGRAEACWAHRYAEPCLVPFVIRFSQSSRGGGSLNRTIAHCLRYPEAVTGALFEVARSVNLAMWLGLGFVSTYHG